MSEKKHTSEPWSQGVLLDTPAVRQMSPETIQKWESDEKNSVFSNFYPSDVGISRLVVARFEREEDLLRAVECVNACAGMVEPTLQIKSLKLANEILEVSKSELTEERDDLNKCTKDMSEHVVLIEELNSKLLTERDLLIELLQNLEGIL